MLFMSVMGVFSLVCFVWVRERRGELGAPQPLAGGPLLTLEEGIKEQEHDLEEHGKAPHFLL